MPGPAAPPANLGVTLRAPVAWSEENGRGDIGVKPVTVESTDSTPTRVVRAQGLDPIPSPFTSAPPPPPPPPPGAFGAAPSNENYNCAVTVKRQPGFWEQTGIPDTFGQVFVPADTHNHWQSDHCFDNFCSPVSNPFYFADPRSLTEVKPLVIYQKVPSSNYAFGGGNIWFYGVQGSLAINDVFSVWINKLGAVTMNPNTTAFGVSGGTGLAEFSLGPKFTFIRSRDSQTLLAAGLNFDMAIGSGSVFQNTGTLALVPYFSFGQGIPTPIGGFNFINTTGYSVGIDDQRSDFFFSSFHLDYDVAGLHKIYPLVELNWFGYTQNGNSNQFFGFEGRDLANFGSGGVAGHQSVSIAAGARYKFAEWLQMGLIAEFPLVHKDLMDYRIGFDIIFRY